MGIAGDGREPWHGEKGASKAAARGRRGKGYECATRGVANRVSIHRARGRRHRTRGFNRAHRLALTRQTVPSTLRLRQRSEPTYTRLEQVNSQQPSAAVGLVLTATAGSGSTSTSRHTIAAGSSDDVTPTIEQQGSRRASNDVHRRCKLVSSAIGQRVWHAGPKPCFVITRSEDFQPSFLHINQYCYHGSPLRILQFLSVQSTAMMPQLPSRLLACYWKFFHRAPRRVKRLRALALGQVEPNVKESR